MKKILVGLICVSIVVLLGVFFFFKNKIDTENNVNIGQISFHPPTTENKLDGAVGLDNCGSFETIDAVVSSKNIAKCDCLESILVENCKNTVSDNLFYTQAYQQVNLSLCSKISSEQSKIACISAVNNRISALEKNKTDELLSVYMSTGKFDEAIKILVGIVASEQKTAKYLNFLALTYAEKGLTSHTETTYVPKALTVVEKAKKIEPTNPETYRVEGYVYEIKPDLEKAIESYNQALVIDINYIPAYAGRGHANELKGDSVAALADFNKAASLDVDQKNINIYSNLCRINSYAKNIDGAVKNCSIVLNSNLASNQAKAAASRILGSMYSSDEEYSKALTQFKLSESYSPNDVNLMVSMAIMFLSSGDAEQAEIYGRKAIALDPNKAIAYENLSASQMLQGKNSEAINSAMKALELVPKDVSILQNYKKTVNSRIYSVLAEVYKRNGDTVNQTKYETLRDSLN